ncbi:MAG: oligosaccharide flippase family protein, partial [Myxococcales bacterium]|nr:oligosaccharide flippase family protein [Myxococcales bacterium]
MTQTREDETRKAGRGLIWVTSGKIFFIVTAYTVALALPRVFGSEEVYGLFSVAFGAAAMLNAVLISSTLQTVSKLVSEDEAHAPQVLRRALTLQLAIGLGLGGLLALGAPWLAVHVFRNAAFTPLIRVSAAVVLAYALYAALVGYLNGHQRFARQAQLDMTFSVLRTVGLVGGAALGIGAIGALAGFAAAAVAILVIALVLVGVGKGGGAGVSWRRLLGFLAPIWLY